MLDLGIIAGKSYKKLVLMLVVAISLTITSSTNNVFAESVTIDQGSTVTVGSDATLTIDSDDTNSLTNQGTLNVERSGTVEIQQDAEMLNDCTGVTNVDTGGEVAIGTTQTALLTNHGIINGDGEINLSGFDVSFLNSGFFADIVNTVATIIESPCPAVAVGGTILPTDTTALLLAGFQVNAIWILPALGAAAGIGVFLVRKAS